MAIIYQHDKRSGITYAYESKSYNTATLLSYVRAFNFYVVSCSILFEVNQWNAT